MHLAVVNSFFDELKIKRPGMFAGKTVQLSFKCKAKLQFKLLQSGSWFIVTKARSTAPDYFIAISFRYNNDLS